MTAEDPSLSIRAFADELPVAIWVGRVPGGELVYVNQAFEEILGMGPPEEAARGNYAESYSVHDREGAPYPERRMPYELAVAARQTIVVDDLVIHRGMKRIYLRVLARPLFDAEGTMTHVVEAFMDISREVAAERARAEGEARLSAAMRMEAIGQLAGGIAHDFNNLLAAIKLLARQLREGERDAAKLETLAHIDQATGSAAELTRALLAFAQRGKHLSQRVALNAVVASVAALGQRTIGRGIEVRCELRAATGDVVGDVSQLEQVVLNLVLNARDAMAGSGSLDLCTYDRPGPGDGEVVLEVRDSGTGIDPSVRDRIFEPYVTTKTGGSIKGTGLGLATAYGVLKAHGGSIEVASTGAAGTTMRVVLPAASPRPPALRTAPPPPPPPPLRRGQGTVLVIDDEPLVRSSAATALRGLGYDVLDAEDGLRAAELHRARPPGAIDAVLLDLVMPRMSGHETFLALRSHDPHVAVLLSTGCALNDEAQRLLDAGALGFLAKPFDPEALSEAIAQVIAQGLQARKLTP